MNLSGILSQRAFSLPELLVGLLVMAAVSATVLVVYPDVTRKAELNKALTRAKIIDAARSLYAANAIDSTAWDSLATAEDHVGLLTSGGYLSGTVSDYTRFSFGYSLRVDGSIRTPTQVLKDGSPIPLSP